ncbi:hypothetical protein CUM68_14670, partial [Enterococcus faecium]
KSNYLKLCNRTLAAVLIFMIVIWFLNERSKDNQHRRDMEIKSIESIDYLSIITLKKPRS